MPYHIPPNGSAGGRLSSYAAFGGENLYNRPVGRRKCNPPLVAGATTLPGGKHVTGFAGRGAPL